MPLYENVFIARQDISGAQADALADSFTQLIADQGGEVKKREYWGLRNLAYRMNKNRKGHYVLFNIDAPAPAIAELERTMRINEDVLRYMTIRVDELEEGPSPVMQNRGSREDRPRRSDRERYGEGRGDDARERADRCAGRAGGGVNGKPDRRGPGSRWWSQRWRGWRWRRCCRSTAAIFPPTQILPVLRAERAEDRLQGRAPVAALRLRARQDRAEPHHRGVDQKQRELSRAIKRARFLGLLPYMVK